MKRPRLDGFVFETSVEVERFAAFDHPTRRFIAYALSQLPELAKRMLTSETVAGNVPAPFVVSPAEEAERAAAYAALPALRACTAKGAAGQRERRLHFADLIGMARVDVRWKRLVDIPQFIFCYERLVGPAWRQLLVPCWIEAAHQRKSKAPVQLPLDRRLREDGTVPKSLENDPPPVFYPSMADADSIGSPLLAGL